MRVLVPLLLVFACAADAFAEERPAKVRAFIEVHADNRAPYVGQRFVVSLRLGIDRAWFEAHAVPLFRQPMDVPVQVDASWLRALPGTRDPLTDPDRAIVAAGGLSFALNDEVVRARARPDVVRGGTTFAVLEIRRLFEATTSGALAVPAPSLRFAHATQFEDDFVGGRVAINRLDETIHGDALLLTVRPLPTAGRPDGFAGAVGRFQVAARLDESRFETAEILRLHFDVRGEGNLWTFPAPRLGPSEGIHLYGMTESREPGVRTFTYEFAPTSSRGTEVPAVTLPFFDPLPSPGAYHLAQSQPVPLTVRLPAPSEGAGERPPPSPPREEAVREEGLWRRIRVCLGMFLLALCVGLYVRRRQATLPPVSLEGEGETASDEARSEALRTAHAALRTALGSPAAVDALTAYLAAHLAVPQAVVVAPDLGARLAAAGVPPDLAVRTADVLAQHVAARYGAPSPEGTHALDAALVDSLQEALQEVFEPEA